MGVCVCVRACAREVAQYVRVGVAQGRALCVCVCGMRATDPELALVERFLRHESDRTLPLLLVHQQQVGGGEVVVLPLQEEKNE